MKKMKKKGNQWKTVTNEKRNIQVKKKWKKDKKKKKKENWNKVTEIIKYF